MSEDDYEYDEDESHDDVDDIPSPPPQKGFQLGNQFWMQRSKHGPDVLVKDPNALYEACFEYFKWCKENPLSSEKVGFSKGKVLRTTIYHPRAMTIKALTCFLGIVEVTWYDWRKNRPDLLAVIKWAEQVIWEQKFADAAAGLLNANIISRELGLAEKQVHEVTAPAMTIKPPDGPAPIEPPIAGEE